MDRFQIKMKIIKKTQNKNKLETQHLRHVHLETLSNMLMAFCRELSWFWIIDIVRELSQSPRTTDTAARIHSKEQVTINCWEDKKANFVLQKINQPL